MSKVTKAGKENIESQKFKGYFDYAEPLSRIAAHRLLAILRGASEGWLNVKIDADAEKCGNKLYYDFCQERRYPSGPLAEQIRMAVNCFHNAGKNQKDSLARIKNLEFTVLSEDAIPEEMQKVIQEKHPNPFKITYSDNGFLYIGIGYGEQPAGGFGITVNDLYLTENAIYFDTTLLGPSPDSEAPASDTASYPYLVIKTEYIDEPVVFK